jgi:hypothetical protein
MRGRLPISGKPPNQSERFGAEASMSDFKILSEPVVAIEKPPVLPFPDTYLAVCCDVVNLGKNTIKGFKGKPDREVAQCRVDFLIDAKNPETGKFFRVSTAYMTVSMGELANLRKFMEQWRGKAFTPEEVEAGIIIDKMIGAHALLGITIETSKGSGRQYAKIATISKVPSMMKDEAAKFTVPADYVRMKDRQQENAPAPEEALPAEEDEDDDLPF